MKPRYLENNGNGRTLQFLGFFTLLIVEHKSFEVLLFNLVLHLGSARLYGQRGLGRYSDLAHLSSPSALCSTRSC